MSILSTEIDAINAMHVINIKINSSVQVANYKLNKRLTDMMFNMERQMIDLEYGKHYREQVVEHLIQYIQNK